MRIHGKQRTPQYQAAVQHTTPAPVQDTWYTVLNATNGVRLINCSMQVTAVGETLEMRITIDSQTLTRTQAANAGTDYYPYLEHSGALSAPRLAFSTTDYGRERGFLLEGKDIKVEIRKTTAAGAGDLKATALYSLLR